MNMYGMFGTISNGLMKTDAGTRFVRQTMLPS